MYKNGGENLDKLYNCQEVADRYGVKIITVWDWIRKKKLPAIKIGKEYRIREADLLLTEERNTVSEYTADTDR